MNQNFNEEVLREANEMQEQLTAWRRHLHASVEVGFELTETASYVAKELETMGIPVRPCGRCGLVAELGRGEKEGVFLLRADMDGLPIQEESGVCFAAKNGYAHACGHDMHTAMLLGAARLLKKREQELAGTVRFLFQPAEELLAGAKEMIEAGVLERPRVTGAMMLHVMTGVGVSAGTAIVAAPGISAPAADYFTIEVIGKGCHGSSPNLGVDPVNAAAHLILALQAIQTRELSMGEQAVLTVGSVQGGEAANAIPDRVVLKGTLRTYEEETRVFFKERLKAVAERTAETFGATAEVGFPSGCPSLQNDGALSTEVLTFAKELFGENRAFSSAELTEGKGKDPAAAEKGKAVRGETETTGERTKRSARTAGSEDFAYISERVPSVMVALAAGESRKGYVYPLHHPKVRFDEAALPFGSALLAYTALRKLK